MQKPVKAKKARAHNVRKSKASTPADRSVAAELEAKPHRKAAKAAGFSDDITGVHKFSAQKRWDAEDKAKARKKTAAKVKAKY